MIMNASMSPQYGAICESTRVPSVSVFGWDDVFYPVTYASRGGCRGARDTRELLEVGRSVVRLVRTARRHGRVVIVTESHERWVRDTAELLLPGGAAAALLRRVEILSSRERFGKDFPDQPACWQIAAFSYVTNRHLLSAGAVARVRRAAAAAAAAAAPAPAEAAGGPANGACNGGDAEPANAAEERVPGGVNSGGETSGGGGGSGGGKCDVRPCDREDGGSRNGGSSDTGDGAISAEGFGFLIAVDTAPRAPEARAAATILQTYHPNVVIKTVSLVEAPTPLDLKNQLNLLAEKFELMLGHATVPSQAQAQAAPAAAAAAAVAAEEKLRLGAGGAEIKLEADKEVEAKRAGGRALPLPYHGRYQGGEVSRLGFLGGSASSWQPMSPGSESAPADASTDTDAANAYDDSRAVADADPWSAEDESTPKQLELVWTYSVDDLGEEGAGGEGREENPTAPCSASTASSSSSSSSLSSLAGVHFAGSFRSPLLQGLSWATPTTPTGAAATGASSQLAEA